MRTTHTHYYGGKRQDGNFLHVSRPIAGDHETNRTYRILPQSGEVMLDLPVPIEQIKGLFVGTMDAIVPNICTAWDRDSGLPFPFPEGVIRTANPGEEEATLTILIVHDEPPPAEPPREALSTRGRRSAADRLTAVG